MITSHYQYQADIMRYLNILRLLFLPICVQSGGRLSKQKRLIDVAPPGDHPSPTLGALSTPLDVSDRSADYFNYKVCKQLGEGCFGTIRELKGKTADGVNVVALKCPRKLAGNMNPYELKNVKNELENHKILNDRGDPKNIARMLAYHFTDGCPVFIFELYDKSVGSGRRQRQPSWEANLLTLNHGCAMLSDVLHGLQFMHDAHLGNIMLAKDKDMRFVLIDLGLTYNENGDNPRYNNGPPITPSARFSSPHIDKQLGDQCTSPRTDYKSDLFSLLYAFTCHVTNTLPWMEMCSFIKTEYKLFKHVCQVKQNDMNHFSMLEPLKEKFPQQHDKIKQFASALYADDQLTKSEKHQELRGIVDNILRTTDWNNVDLSWKANVKGSILKKKKTSIKLSEKTKWCL